VFKLTAKGADGEPLSISVVEDAARHRRDDRAGLRWRCSATPAGMGFKFWRVPRRRSDRCGGPLGELDRPGQRGNPHARVRHSRQPTFEQAWAHGRTAACFSVEEAIAHASDDW